MVEPSAGPGHFISFEGGEGAGKSTQLHRLADFLRALAVSVVTTREPGGSPGAEEIRDLLVSGDPGRWDPVCEALLLHAARRNHYVRTIEPALQAGKWVLSDRFSDSTMAYQGIAHGLGVEVVQSLHKLTLGDVKPDLTIVLDIAPEVGLLRATRRASSTTNGVPEDRFERMERGFHERLRDGFHAIAAAEPDRVIVIDAGGSVDAIAELVSQRVAVRFALPGQRQ